MKKSNLKNTNINSNNSEGVLMTIPPQKKKRKTIKIETENTKKEKEEIEKQKILKTQIEELDKKIKNEQEQYNKIILSRKQELIQTEERLKSMDDKNEQLKLTYEIIQKEFENKYSNNKKDKNINENKKETPINNEIKENINKIEHSRKIMEKYKKDIDKLENLIRENTDINQVNNLKYEIKKAKERIDILEKEKKYLIIIKSEHDKCIEAQEKIKKEINYYNTEINKLKTENDSKLKEKREKYKNDLRPKNINLKKKIDLLLSPNEVNKIKEQKIKKSIDEFWALNKKKLLKYSLSDNDVNINTKSNKNKIMKTDISYNDNLKEKIKNEKLKEYELYTKKKNYSENLKNLNLDINTYLPPLPLFNVQEKEILSKILPSKEIKKYEKRYEYAEIEKKNLLRKFALENKKILREEKLMKNEIEKKEQKLKLNEAKNDALNSELEMKEKEYEKMKNKLNDLRKELENKKNKIKIWTEENILMKEKYQPIRDKYEDNNEKDKEDEDTEEEDEND